MSADLTEERLAEIEQGIAHAERIVAVGGAPLLQDTADLRDVIRAYRAKVEECNEALSAMASDGADAVGLNAVLRAELSKERTVCICGCPDADHESYEEGESCSNDEHECIRVCLAAQEMYVAKVEECKRLCAELVKRRKDSDRLDWLASQDQTVHFGKGGTATIHHRPLEVPPLPVRVVIDAAREEPT